jgi:exosortase D (VPLPA-CTERM-specific)
MFHQWWTLDMYSHGFFIPLISSYLVWIKRKELSAIQLSPSYILGYVILICSMVLFLLGEVGGIVILQGLSLLPTIAGIIILLFGIRLMRILLIPIAYLVFMIPIWEMVTQNLHPPFQDFSASMGGVILTILQIPVYVNGKIIELPNVTFQVARECSGVNYLISIIAIGIPLAFLFLKSMKKRFILILSAIVIAIFANGLRVALIGIFAYNGIGSSIHGPFHIMQGVLVSLVGYTVLFAGLRIMHQERPRSSKPGYEIVNKNAAYKRPSYVKKMFFPAISVIILFAVLESYSYFRALTPIPLKANLDLFPIQIDGWEGKDVFLPHGKYEYPGVDLELNRTYRKGSDTVNLYIGYFEFQKQGKELIYYKTKDLHSNASKIKVDINPYGIIEINKTVIQDLGHRMLTIFWYDMNGRIVTERFMGKFYTIWDALIKGRTNGAVIMIATDLNPGENLSDKLSMIKRFAGKTYLPLKNYLPAK